MTTVQNQSTSNPSSITQKAAVAALNGDQSCIGEMNRHYKARHDYLVAALNDTPGISCLEGAGTFYALANVEEAMSKLGLGDDLFCLLPIQCMNASLPLFWDKPLPKELVEKTENNNTSWPSDDEDGDGWGATPNNST